MLKLPKGLKKKKKGKKSKRKGEDELFTEEELAQYKQQQKQGEGSKENEEWSKFKHLTTGVDSVLKKSQGDLDRIKESSFFQRIPAGARQVDHPAPDTPAASAIAPCVELTAADFPHLQQQPEEHSECPSEESEEEDQEDIFDTSYVEAVERGEVRLALVPDSPEQPPDDVLFDTSHVDRLIRGESRSPRGKKALDIGVAVEVLTGRIDNVQLPSVKRPAKRVIPGDLLLGGDATVAAAPPSPPKCSILDTSDDIPPAAPLDLSVSLHPPPPPPPAAPVEEEEDEFSQLAAQSLEAPAAVRLACDVTAPVPQEAWSAFEADRGPAVFAEGIAEDELDDPYLGQDDPFDTSFADGVVPPRLNNRRRSSVRIHLTDPTGERESITSDDAPARDLLAGSCGDLTQCAATPLAPATVAADDSDFDPFDTSGIEAASAPGPRELRLLEQELITASAAPVYRVPSDPDFDPRADEPAPAPTRRASRPENLSCKSVGFSIPAGGVSRCAPLPATPYYCRDEPTLTRTHSEEELVHPPPASQRRHSALPLHAPLTPRRPAPPADPFDTSFASAGPGRAELRLLAKEFSCEETSEPGSDLLEPENDLFQVRVLSPALLEKESEDIDPFDTSFATDLKPGRTELKLLESEFLQ